MDPLEVDLKALQDRNRRLQSSLMMTMGMIKTLQDSLQKSLEVNRYLEVSLGLSQRALEQVLQTSSLDKAEVEPILQLIRESLRGLQDGQQQADHLNTIS